jgi:hemoglobin
MPSDPRTAPTPYEVLGGEPALRRLTHRFYELMDTLPEAWAIRQLHPEGLSGSEQKLFQYLSGWLGGPDLYVQQHGHPRLRARHLPFAIASRERDEWMLCMRMACDELVGDEALRGKLLAALASLADHMRNRQDPSSQSSV